MRSFALSLISILAFGAFSWAAPVPSEDNLVGPVLSDNFEDLLSGNVVQVVGINHRGLVDDVLSNNFDHSLADNAVQVVGINEREILTLSIVLTELRDHLGPVTEQLKSIKAQDATVEHLTPLVAQINVILGDAVTSVKCLVGRPISEILATVDGELDAAHLAKLLADVINLVMIAVGAVFDLVADLHVHELLCTILSALACLIQEVLSLVGSTLAGVLGCLLPLIGGVLHFILELNVETLIRVLCL
jgi:hypothetical protein